MGGACGVIALRRAARAVQAGDVEIVALHRRRHRERHQLPRPACRPQQLLARRGVSVPRRRPEREFCPHRRCLYARDTTPAGRISANWPSHSEPMRDAIRLPCCAARADAGKITSPRVRSPSRTISSIASCPARGADRILVIQGGAGSARCVCRSSGYCWCDPAPQRLPRRPGAVARRLGDGTRTHGGHRTGQPGAERSAGRNL